MVWTAAASNPTYLAAGDDSDEYGYSVAVSMDGAVYAVGCPGEDSVTTGAGGVYIYDRPAGPGGPLVLRGSMLVAADLVASDRFGTSVALNGDGSVLVVGTSDGGDGPRWYTFDWSGSAWVQRGTSEVSPTTYGIVLGAALSSDGTVLALGCSDANTVYVYDWSGSAWSARGTITPGGTTTYISELSLSSDGATLVIGKQLEYASGGGGFGTGAVYTYTWNGSSWSTFGTTLINSGPTTGDPHGVYQFGDGVGISPNGLTLTVGCTRIDLGGFTDAGRVYTFTKGATEWEHDATLNLSGDADYLYLGSSVSMASISGALVLLVGASGYNRTGALIDHGAVYLYDIFSPFEDITDSGGAADTLTSSAASMLTSTADGADVLSATLAPFINELVRYTVTLSSTSNTKDALVDTAAIVDVAQQALNQIVTDTANGTVLLNPGIAVQLIDLANAATAHTPAFNTVMAIAELIATAELYNGADGYDITETGDFAEAFAARVDAIAAILDTAQALDTDSGVVTVFQLQTDTAAGADTLSYTGSILTALLDDTTLATVRLNIGGELFTGWVMNTDTFAASEYQFVDRQFNSACKHGDQYLMAADDGIYAFTETRGVESVMTYIKTGKMDFGSDLKKRIVNSYIVYSASGQMVLKVTTSEFGQLVTRNYKMVPPSNSETTDTRRFDLGKGIRSRYWQFELVGDGVDCEIDEIGMLPVLLSRRI